MITEGRLYPSRNSYYIDHSTVVNAPGNGIKIYTGIIDGLIGRVLKLFNKAEYIKVDGESYLVNIASLAKFILRRHEIASKDFQYSRRPPNFSARNMQTHYEDHMKSGNDYNPQLLKRVTDTFKGIQNKDVSEVIDDGLNAIGTPRV